MIKRFKIEDLIIQDESGVVFRAFDQETHQFVALRRFFPFGADGGGLNDEEKIAYDVILHHLASLRHPALSSVVGGGCDPVDCMPFIAAEWTDDESIQTLVTEQKVSAEMIILLITQLLEICELLTPILGREGIWVDTDLRSIALKKTENGHGFTFSVAPTKWLGGNEASHSLESMITLTEQLMGWPVRVVNHKTGRGLTAWLKWLRDADATTTLKQVREALTTSITTGYSPTKTKLMVPTPAPVVPTVPVPVPNASKTPWMIAIMFVLTMTGLFFGWKYRRKAILENSTVASETISTNLMPDTHVTTELPKENSIERVNQRVAELSANAAKAQPANAVQNGGVFPPPFDQAMKQCMGKSIAVEGVLERIAFSQKRNVMYLIFAGDKNWELCRGAIGTAKAPTDLTEDSLKSLIGKKIRLNGILAKANVPGKELPQIVISARTAIEEVQ